MYFYRTNGLQTYRMDFLNPQYYKINIKVNPCVNKTSDQCCQGANEAVCEDNTNVTAGTDVGIAWFMTGYVMQCSPLFTQRGSCGTYLEIHKPNNETIVEELMITTFIANGFNTEFMSSRNLCAGRYEIWLVVRSRNGSILQHVKPFYNDYPTCQPI